MINILTIFFHNILKIKCDAMVKILPPCPNPLMFNHFPKFSFSSTNEMNENIYIAP